MKKITYILLLLTFFAQGQILNPVKWKSKILQKSATEFELVIEATIENEWHMYSQYTPDGGALPTVFDFKNAKGNYSLVGKTKESPYKKVFNDIFEVDEYYFAKSAQFKQLIKVTNPKLKQIKVFVEYQACKEQCIQQDNLFTFQLPELKFDESAAGDTSVALTDGTTPSDSVKQAKDSVTTEQTLVAKDSIAF